MFLSKNSLPLDAGHGVEDAQREIDGADGFSLFQALFQQPRDAARRYRPEKGAVVVADVDAPEHDTPCLLLLSAALLQKAKMRALTNA